MSYWVVEHGGAPGKFWKGYVSKAKDHVWGPREEAIRFCRREDAEKAGLNFERYKPVYVEVTDEVTRTGA